MSPTAIRENALGAEALAEALTEAGNAAQAEGELDRSRQFYSVNASARKLAADLQRLAKQEEGND